MRTDNIEHLREALSYVPPVDRDVWLRMGMGIKSELGEAGYEVWNSWSQQHESYDAQSAKAVWRSIRLSGKVTAGSVFHEARANGWRGAGSFQQSSREALEVHRRAVAVRSASADNEIHAERLKAAKNAAAIWSCAMAARPDNPYLHRKSVTPVTTLRQLEAERVASILGYVPKSSGVPLVGLLLLVPVKIEGVLSTLEMIDGVGRKAALAGRGTKAGGFWVAQDFPGGDGAGLTILVGEGVATMLTAREATGHLAVASLSSGNLRAVAAIMRDRYPAAVLVILADLAKTTGSPTSKAIEAAMAVGARLAIPDFGSDRQAAETDFNDLARLQGAQAVARDIDSAGIPAEKSAPPTNISGSDGAKATVELLRASAITPMPVTWLWQGYVASGKLMILAGAPGTGKTTIAMAIAATVTTGGIWPDGTRCMVGEVVVWSGEDDPTDTLVPRLLSADADLSRVHFVKAIREFDQSRFFDPANDIEPLQRAICAIGNIRLIIIDPIVSAVAGDSHKNAEVRRALQPIVELAAALGCAVIGITHLSKGTAGRDPVERLTGSLAFGALPRVVLIAARREGDGGGADRILVRAKSNIGPDGGGFQYDLERTTLEAHPDIESSRIVWRGPIVGSPRELLTTAEAVPRISGALDEATTFLAELLATSSMDARDVMDAAEAAGITKATLRRARKSLGIRPKKNGMTSGWRWELPRRCSRDGEDAHNEEMSIFGEDELLRIDDDIGEATE